MYTLFYITLGFAIWHLFYEGIVAPALRYSLRYKFFKLRDQLRRIETKDLKGNDKFVHNLLDETICNLLDSLYYISLGNYFLIKKNFDKSDDNRNKRIENFIDNIENKELKDIEKSIRLLSASALLINNGAWSLYLIPPILFFILTSLFIKSQISNFKSIISKISSVVLYSEKEVELAY